MADRIALQGRGSRLALVPLIVGLYFVAYGLGAVLWVSALAVVFLVQFQWRAKRWRQDHPGESFPPRPEPARVHVVTTRPEAGLFLATFLGLWMMALSVAIDFIVNLGTVIITGSRTDADSDWTPWLLVVSIASAVLTFLAYAVLAARRTHRRGEPALQMSQVASQAAVRQAVTQFRSRPSM